MSPRQIKDDKQTKFNEGFSNAIVEKPANEHNDHRTLGDNQFDSLTNQLPNNQSSSVENIPEFQLNGPSENISKSKVSVETGWKKFQGKVFIVIESKAFNVITIVLIVINTIFMALEHYDQPDSLT